MAIGYNQESNFDQWRARKLIPRQTVTDKDNFDPLDTEDTEIENDEIMSHEKEKTAEKGSETMAWAIVASLDLISSLAFSYIDKTGDREQYKFTKQEESKLTEAWSNFLKTKNLDLSPGWGLAFVSASVIAPRLMSAVYERSQNKNKPDKMQKTIPPKKTKKEDANSVQDGI
jgi:hypothetical protein